MELVQIEKHSGAKQFGNLKYPVEKASKQAEVWHSCEEHSISDMSGVMLASLYIDKLQTIPPHRTFATRLKQLFGGDVRDDQIPIIGIASGSSFLDWGAHRSSLPTYRSRQKEVLGLLCHTPKSRPVGGVRFSRIAARKSFCSCRSLCGLPGYVVRRHARYYGGRPSGPPRKRDA